MRVRVLFFAASREAAGGAPEREFELADGATTHTLRAALLAALPALGPIMASAVFAVNQEYVEPATALPLKHNDEVAVIPPLSGG